MGHQTPFIVQRKGRKRSYPEEKKSRILDLDDDGISIQKKINEPCDGISFSSHRKENAEPYGAIKMPITLITLRLIQVHMCLGIGKRGV